MRYFSIFLICISAIACSSTKIIGSWKNSDLSEKQYGNIMIAALTADNVAKGNVEEQMAEVLVARGVRAKGAGGVFNPEMEITQELKDQIATNLKSQGFDALLTFTLIAAEEKTDYVPGTYSYSPYSYGYYGSYWGYYGYYAPQVYQPGYYTSSEVYTVEAVLYDLDTEKMAWAARSETTDPASLDRFSREFTETVAYQLQKDRMLNTGK